eukprot:TRINITY_DN10351_c0_g1_i1.p1 TRINITY_DN10351_c0_g1~~TRINITY_DN10351_c0_g1_i1.p1  ORF type:complete len:227 (-),score=65.68 TRINITY_DN10351_c0_g1_i1:76-756(-)
MRTFAVALLLAASALAQEEGAAETAPKVEAKKPILTTDIIHGTGELIFDLYDAAYNKIFKHHVDKHSETVRQAVADVLPKDPITEVCAKVGCQKEQVLKHMDTASDLAQQASNTVQDTATQLHEATTAGTHKVVDQFESMMPTHRGLIPRTPLNLLLFCLWIVAVIYVSIKVSLFFMRLGFSAFIFTLKLMCCCGCCTMCRKSKPAAPSSNAKTSNPKKASAKKNK